VVDPAVMTTAGIAPEQDLRSHKPPQSAAINDIAQSGTASPDVQAPSKPAGPVEDPGRLSIFEDFLSKLDTNKPPSKPDDPEKPDA
jgi:hypothetical protein